MKLILAVPRVWCGRSECGWRQEHAKERTRAQTQVCKSEQKSAKERKRALPRTNCKRPGLKNRVGNSQLSCRQSAFWEPRHAHFYITCRMWKGYLQDVERVFSRRCNFQRSRDSGEPRKSENSWSFSLTVKLLCLQSLKTLIISKKAKLVSKTAPIVSKKAQIVNCK